MAITELMALTELSKTRWKTVRRNKRVIAAVEEAARQGEGIWAVVDKQTETIVMVFNVPPSRRVRR
ncbi:MAG: hypothetical protein H0U16_07075 [Actinobacteria bacterium]|nr:hypothetical protein [Actinomycetota bacterium]